MTITRPLLATLFILLAATPLAAHEDEGDAAPAIAAPAPAAGPAIAEDQLALDPRFSGARIAADVGFFADDLLKGRDLGSKGHEIAARYVAARMAALGLKRGGDNGTYLQRITFQKTEYAEGKPAGITISGPGAPADFAHGKDVLVSLNPNLLDLDVTAPVVFVGYGIDNALAGINDYKGLDVRGKIVLVLRGYPRGLPSEEGAHLSATKGAMAQAHGAIGVITMGTNASLRVRPWAASLQYTRTPSLKAVETDGRVTDETPGIKVSAQVDDAAAEALLAGAPTTLTAIRAEADRDGGRPRGFALRTSAHLTVHATATRVTSPNVVGILPGSDPKLADQYVALSAHLDHLGIDKPKPGDAPGKDRIYNGALDNAAGSATTLEVARVMSEDKTGPRRSVIFLISTGEEKGLLGADWYARHPTVPAGSIVGNVDLDMPLLLYPFTDVVAFGSDHSTLGPIVASAVRPMHLALAPDPMPDETIFVRSDHYMFVKRGVPAVFLATGFANGGAAQWADFMAHRYHKPGDDMSQAFDWRAGARFAEANYRITHGMADSDSPPMWYAGDFFGRTFAPKAASAKRP
jgi:hypothetical protein